MICHKCGAQIMEGSEFCHKCGAKAAKELLCQKCGNKVVEGSDFCHKCGARLASSNQPVQQIPGNVAAPQAPPHPVNTPTQPQYGQQQYTQQHQQRQTQAPLQQPKNVASALLNMGRKKLMIIGGVAVAIIFIFIIIGANSCNSNSGSPSGRSPSNTSSGSNQTRTTATPTPAPARPASRNDIGAVVTTTDGFEATLKSFEFAEPDEFFGGREGEVLIVVEFDVKNVGTSTNYFYLQGYISYDNTYTFDLGGYVDSSSTYLGANLNPLMSDTVYIAIYVPEYVRTSDKPITFVMKYGMSEIPLVLRP